MSAMDRPLPGADTGPVMFVGEGAARELEAAGFREGETCDFDGLRARWFRTRPVPDRRTPPPFQLDKHGRVTR